MSSPPSVPSPPESASSQAVTISTDGENENAYRSEKFRLRRLSRDVMKKRVPIDVVKRAIELYDLEKFYDTNPPEVMNEVERMLGMEGVEWPYPKYRLVMIAKKLGHELTRVLRSYGYGLFSSYGENGRARLEIAPRPGQDPPELPEWLQIPYLVPVKGYSLRYRPETCANPTIQGGDILYDRDCNQPVGTLGTIMASSQIGKDDLAYVALTAGHVISDGDNVLHIRNRKDNSFIPLKVASSSRRINGRPFCRQDKDPAFQDDVGLLIVSASDIAHFDYRIPNLNVHYFSNPSSTTDTNPLSTILDPTSLPRDEDINRLISQTGSVVVYKRGGETDLTVGRLVKLSQSPPQGWYELEATDGGRSNWWEELSESDEDGDEGMEEWIGVVKWTDIPFSAPGDSGSLVFAIQDGITIPLGIHVGAPESMPGHSIFISLETFCFGGEHDGWELCFTNN